MTSAYEKPPENQPDQQQGSVESALAGDYDFDIAAIITEAWEKTDGVKWPFQIALSIYGAVYLLVGIGVPFVLSGFTLEFAGWAEVIGSLLNLAVAYPVMAGVMMMGLNRAAGRPVYYQMSLQFFTQALPIFILMVVMTIMASLGFLLLIIPGMYLIIAYMFALLLMLDKNMGPWEALETSRKAVTHHWFKIFGIVLVMSVIMMISILPLGIGLIWTLPMMYIMNGLLYQRIFGVGIDKQTPYLA